MNVRGTVLALIRKAKAIVRAVTAGARVSAEALGPRTKLVNASPWAEMIHQLEGAKAEPGIVDRHCDQWMEAEGIEAVRDHLAQLPPQQLSSFAPAVEWLFRQRDRSTPEADLPLAEKLLAVANPSPSFRAAVLVTACQFGDMATVELLDAAFSGNVSPSSGTGRVTIYRALVSEPSDLSGYEHHLFRALVNARLGDQERLVSTDFRSDDGHVRADSVAATAMILALCTQCGWPDVSQAVMSGVNSWRTKYVFRLASSDLLKSDRATQNALLDILLVRDDLSAKHLRWMVALLATRPGRQQTFLARRAHFKALKDDPGLSNLLIQWLDHDPEFLPALETNDVERVSAKLAIYEPEHASTFATTRIESVAEVCNRGSWPYQDVIPSSAMTVHHPRFFGEGETVASETVMHPPIYKAELHNAVVHGGSWFIASGGSGVYEPMQIPAYHPHRFIHRDSTALFGAGKYLLHRRVPPERHVDVAIWMLGFAAHYYYHWLYDVCSRSLAYGEFGTFPPGTSILVDEAVLAVPQLAEILDLLNSYGLNVETVGLGEAVEVGRLFVAAPSAWTGTLRKGKYSPALDYIIHPQAVSALRQIAARHLSELCPRRRIFISRRGARNPRLGNEAELAALVETEFGFEVIDPSALSFAEQVCAFSEAEAIVGASGAAMANLAFCSEGSKAYCFVASKVIPGVWQSIAAAAGCKATHLVGQRTALARARQNLITIDPDQLRSALRETLNH